MSALSGRFGHGLPALLAAAAALLGTLAPTRGWYEPTGAWAVGYRLLVWFGGWGLAGHLWHRWVHAAWKPSASGFGVNRACWFGALIQVVAGEGFRALDAPGWWWLDVAAALLVAAGFNALRPRGDRDALPAASRRQLWLAALCWPALGLAVGVAAGEPKAGVLMGLLGLAGAGIVVFSTGAMFVEGARAGAKAQAGTLSDDLALLWKAGLPPRRAAEAAPEPALLSGFEFRPGVLGPKQGQEAGSAPGARHEESVDRPTLVDSGSFRVDTEKALEKLSRFRSADPAEFILGFFRCAVAAGATRFEIQGAGGVSHRLSLRFDGNPVEAAALSDPLSSMLAGGLGGAERELAGGLLSVLGFADIRVFIASGEGGARRVLRVAAKGCEPWAVRDPGEGTFVDLRAGARAPAVQAAVEILRRRAGMVELDWSVNGQAEPEGPAAPGPSGWWVHRRKDMEVRLAPRRDLDATSRLRFYRLGTLIEEAFERKLTPFPVDACVRDDRFALDISQAKIVRDQRYKAALAAVDSAFAEFNAQLRRTHYRVWPKLKREADPPGVLGRTWRGLRRAAGWRSAADVAKDDWEREVGQWLSATHG
ncbi:MAG: hypothetical protein HY553_19175 [Elusimicrobia bacterium]|nr:hypothetical protein [Elusimicrobiota bacterium]